MVQWRLTGETGLLCRDGKDLKSAELQRVSAGSILEQLEPLAGDRLHFRLVSGDGPLRGWVSVKVKGKDVAVKQEEETAIVPQMGAASAVQPCTEEDLDLGPSKPVQDRPYSITVYGATGYTGQLIAQHLDAVFAKQPGRPWAIAGRNAERLAAVKKLCKTDVAVLLVRTEEEVHKMVGDCCVVISAIGPHARWGEPVIRACVALGTHYTDIAGEFWWLKRMIAKYDAAARKRGVIIVLMCAQQATIADISVLKLVKKLGALRQVRGYALQVAFTSGGTDNNGRWGMECLMHNPAMHEDFMDPFAMGGIRKGGVQEVDKDCNTVAKDSLYPKLWLGPLGCAGTDCRCLRRSCALFEEARGGRSLDYGEDVHFIWRDPCTSKAAAERLLQMMGPLPSADMAGQAFGSMLHGCLTGQSPPPGQGAPRDVRQQCYVKYVIVAEGENGQWATVRYNGGDPYEVTSMCAAEGALTLLEDQELLNAEGCGGLVTPAFAFDGSGFLDRLTGRSWAYMATSATTHWVVEDGQPTQEDMMKLVMDKSAAWVKLQPGLQDGSVKQWALPDYGKR